MKELMNEIERVQEDSSRSVKTEELSRTIPMLVHQINNPLQAIYGSAQLAMLSLTDQGTT